ncbi:c-type cytochrome [Novosphingobium huizhouense]|uniref:c-type cytochrome n=1 Tax=Novosphingobium huizhouense TaxID=2866625 RepID=UPI001CD82E4D|nr:cytochrome c [Novosphingobium huizhouense]
MSHQHHCLANDRADTATQFLQHPDNPMIHAKTIVLALAAVSALAGGAASVAALTPQQAIDMRHANFEKMGKAMKAIGGELKSGAPNKGLLLANAKIIAAAAPQVTKLFPAGTGPSSGLKTDALPAIWTDRATFDALGGRLVGEANKLVGVAGSGDAAAVGAQMKALGGVCGECHRKFRKED